MSKNPSALSHHIGYSLRKLSNTVSTSFATRLSNYDVSVPQWVVLRILFEHISLPLKEIVTQIQVDQGSLSRMIDRMISRGLLLRKEDPRDRRAIAISLTKTGRNLVPKLAAEADQNEEAFFAILSKSEREKFHQTIQKLLLQNQCDQCTPIE